MKSLKDKFESGLRYKTSKWIQNKIAFKIRSLVLNLTWSDLIWDLQGYIADESFE